MGTSIIEDSEFYPLPVNLFDMRPEFNDVIVWSDIDENKIQDLGR